MFSRTTFVVSAFAAALAANLCSSGQAVSGEPMEGDALYRPIQSISYTFGSKIASGYFVQQNSVCRVTLMIAEKIDPGLPSPTAARVRVMLDPGQVVGFDSDEGRSISLTCGEDAATLVVSYGERSKLIALQGLAVTNTFAERVQREAGRIGSPTLAHHTSD
jgi:hypothetical protein